MPARPSVPQVRSIRSAPWPRVAAWIALALTIVPAVARSQAERATPSPDPPVAALAQAAWIPVPSIPQAAETLQQQLRRLSEITAKTPTVERIDQELPEFERSTASRLSETASMLEASPTLDQLRDLESEWSEQVDGLATRTRTLVQRATQIEADLEGLARDRERWARTLEHARETESPANVLALVQTNLDAMDRMSARLAERRSAVLSSLTSLTELEQQSAQAREQVETTRASIRSRLLAPDSPPLWRIERAPEEPPSVDRLLETKSREWADVEAFLLARGRSLVPVGLLFVAALLGARFVRDRLRKRAGGGALEGSAAVFERPASAAFVSLAVLSGWALPYAPGLVWDLIGVALVFPTLRLVGPIVPRATRPILGALALFYLTGRVRDLVVAAELLERWIFLVETAVAAFALAWFLRPARLAEVADRELVPRRLGLPLRFALVALVVSTLANALGYVAFARVLGDGTLEAMYLAILAYAVYRIGLTLVVVGLSSRTVEPLHALSSNAQRLTRWAERGLAIAAGVVWLLGSFDAFAVRDVVVDFVVALVSTPIEIGTLSVSIGSVFAFPLTILAAWLLSSGIREVLEEDVYPRVSLRRGVGNAITSGLHYSILLGGFFLALGAAGIDLSKFALLAGAFGVGIGFGLQNVVNNFVSGLILLVERPIQVGDMVELGTLLGEVKKIGIRASTIVTFQGAEVIVPNGNLLSDQLINWTLSDKKARVEIPVGVAYGNDPDAVMALLHEVIDADSRVLRDPEPVVLFRAFGDSSLDFEMRVWIEDFATFQLVRSDLLSKVSATLAGAGIEIPFPQRDLHVRSVDAGAARALRASEASE